MNQRIQEEWNKIKEYNVFKDINDFSKLFIDKPNGKCFRKYITYPWSKENFFFGTNEELQEFYKNTEEIPFYVKKYVGKKYGRLTIIDFKMKKNKKNENKLFAICLCDCGNTYESEFKPIQHGDRRSCGCSKNLKTLYDKQKEFVDKYWDYDNNNVSPKNVDINSTQEYWWKGDKRSFLMSPKTLQEKQQSSIGGTSFPEQAIFYYIKKYFPDTENRKKIKILNGNVEVDIFIPSIKVAIEYDGVNWHNEKTQEDINKNNWLFLSKIYLIRIRETGLVDIPIKFGKNVVCDINKKPQYFGLVKVINNILTLLNKFKSFNYEKIDLETFKNHIPIIKGNYLPQIISDNNIASHWLSKFWSNNNTLNPYSISIKSEQKCFFKCYKGYDFITSPKQILSIYNNTALDNQTSFKEKLLKNGDECVFINFKMCPCRIEKDKFCIFAEIDKLFYTDKKDALVKNLYLLDYLSENFYKDKELNIRLITRFFVAMMYILKTKTHNRPIKYNNQNNEEGKVKNLEAYSKISTIIDNFILSKDIKENDKMKIINYYFNHTNIYYADVDDKAVVLLNTFPQISEFYFRKTNYSNIFKNRKKIILGKQNNELVNILKSMIIFRYINFFERIVGYIVETIGKENADDILNIVLNNLIINYSYNKEFLYSNEQFLKKCIEIVDKNIGNYKTKTLLNEIYKLRGKSDKIKKCFERQKRLEAENI